MRSVASDFARRAEGCDISASAQCSVACARLAIMPLERAWSRWPCVTSTWSIEPAAMRADSRRASISIRVSPASTSSVVSPPRTTAELPSLPDERTCRRIPQSLCEPARAREREQREQRAEADPGAQAQRAGLELRAHQHVPGRHAHGAVQARLGLELGVLAGDDRLPAGVPGLVEDELAAVLALDLGVEPVGRL